MLVEAIAVAVLLSVACTPEPVPKVKHVLDKEFDKCNEVLDNRLDAMLDKMEEMSDSSPPVSDEDLDEELAKFCTQTRGATTGSARGECIDPAMEVVSCADSHETHQDYLDFLDIASEGSLGSDVESFTPESDGFAFETNSDDCFDSEQSTLITRAAFHGMPGTLHEQSVSSASGAVSAQVSDLSSHVCSTVVSYDPERSAST